MFLSVFTGFSTVLMYAFLVQTVDIVRFLVGPLPMNLCFVQVILRNTTSSNMMLLSNATMIMKYLYAFRIKNPARFEDEFWARFITIWTLLFSFIYHVRQPIGFYICVGEAPPVKDFTHSTFFGIFVIVSSLLHIIILITVTIKQRKVSIGPLTYQAFYRQISLSDIEKRSLSNMLILVFNVVAIFISINVFSEINRVDPILLNSTPYSYFVTYAYLVSPGLLALVSLSFFYGTYKQLRKAVWNELKEIATSRIYTTTN